MHVGVRFAMLGQLFRFRAAPTMASFSPELTINSTAPIGKNVVRKEGVGKVLGRAQYVDDLVLPDMLHGATVRSTIARGRIVDIRFSDAIDWSEFVIVTAEDIPGKNTIVHLGEDHPCLADGFVNHPAEPILLIAHA